MREVVPPPTVREFVGDICRVTVERTTKGVEVRLDDWANEVLVLSPEKFSQLAHELAAVDGRVQEAARAMEREAEKVTWR